MKRAVPLAILCLIVIAPATGESGMRGLLWRVVQTCVANHTLTGGAFPCLEVETDRGIESGYAVLRAPLEDRHIIVAPTVRTIGIEAERLRGADAPNYFHDAWAARHFVTDELPRKPNRSDLGLAVNSRVGRSQDQLHIHVDCLRRDVKRSLENQIGAITPKIWTRIGILPGLPHYWALAVESADLAMTNLVDLAAAGLKIDREEMDDVTMVVAGTDSIGGGAPGFIVLARQRQNKWGDIGHGEALLDHNCAAFR